MFKHSIFGAKNLLEPDLPDMEELSEFQQAKNALRTLKKFGLTKQDFRVIAYLLEHIPN